MPPELSDADLDRLAQRLTDPVADNVAAQLDSGWHGDRLVLSRRQVLALGTMGLGASGLMALGVDRASAQSAAGQVGTSSEPVDVEAASVNAQSVSTVESRTKSHPVVDITHPDYGAVGDGSTDDSAAIQQAVNDAAPNGTVLIPDGIYRLSNTISVDLGVSATDIPSSDPSELQRFTVIGRGALKPDAGIGDGLHIKNGFAPRIPLFRLEGGGQSGDVGLRISDVEYPNVGTVISNNYLGTWVKTQGGSQKGLQAKIGGLYGWDGQPVVLQGDSNNRATGYGHISDAFIRNRDEGSEFRNLTDLSINTFETGAAGASVGVRFDNISSMWVDKLITGGSDPITHVSITNSNRVRITKALASLGDRGFYFDGVNDLKGDFVAVNSDGPGMVVENTGNTARDTFDWDANLYIKDCVKEGLSVGANCGPQMRFHGTVAENGTDGTVPNMDIQTTDQTWLDGMYIIGPSATAGLNVVSGNDVRAVGSRVVGVNGSLSATGGASDVT